MTSFYLVGQNDMGKVQSDVEYRGVGALPGFEKHATPNHVPDLIECQKIK